MTLPKHGLSQETIVTVPFYQPAELSAEAGINIPLLADSLTEVGNNMQITGGTPGYNITWVDPANAYFYNSIIKTSLPGMYHLFVYDEADCSDSDSLVVYTVTPVDISGVPELRLFPNPTSGKLHYSVTGIAGKITLTLISPTGYAMKELQDTDPSGFLDMEMYPAGIYLLRITMGRHAIVRQILIK
jgi:hypothetical protein